VQVFDARFAQSGSKPSGGHLKPSWLSFLDKKVMEESFRTLDELYALETLRCVYGLVHVDLLRVDVDKVLQSGEVLPAKVTQVGDGFLDYENLTCDGESHRVHGTIIVASGVWSGELVPEIKAELSAKKGMSFTFSGVPKQNPPENRIISYLPYKQIVRTAHGPGRVWMGDGSAIIPTNWSEAREVMIKDRVMKHVDFKYKSLDIQRGLRPYLNNGLRRISPNLWVATGGGKSGMALAGVYANNLSRSLA
jgi:glycine/D-amino acid oxidase-like deaminating enzyme